MQHLQTPSLDQARNFAAMGIQRAVDKTEDSSANWVAIALEKFRVHIRGFSIEKEFIFEDIRLAIESELPAPHDLRTWGAVTRQAKRWGYIVDTQKTAPARSSHASRKPLYRRGVFN